MPRSLPTKWIVARSWPRATSASADGEAGEHVAGGAAAGDERQGRDGRSATPHQVGARRRCRATFSRMPAAAIVTSSDEPPKDMNGSGTPVTGSRPITAPMLMNACTTATP